MMIDDTVDQNQGGLTRNIPAFARFDRHPETRLGPSLLAKHLPVRGGFHPGRPYGYRCQSHQQRLLSGPEGAEGPGGGGVHEAPHPRLPRGNPQEDRRYPRAPDTGVPGPVLVRYLRGVGATALTVVVGWRSALPKEGERNGRVTPESQSKRPRSRRGLNELIFWCLEAESNRRHMDFQSIALPTELPRLELIEYQALVQFQVRSWGRLRHP